MNGRPWSNAEGLALQRLIAKGDSLREIADRLGRDVSTLRRKAERLGLIATVPAKYRKRAWTPADVDLLRTRYSDTPTDQLAAELGRSVNQIYQAAQTRGLAKSAAYLASDHAKRIQRGKQHPNMIATRFPRGSVPANKGLRRPGYAPGRMAETQFKPGRPAHQSRNYKPIGSLRVCADGYVERKVTDDPALVPARRWVGVHRLVWEAANGPVPAYHVVVFRPDRFTTDPDAITVDCVELVTRVELMRRNTLHRYPKEIAKLIQLRGALNRKINKRSKTA